MIDLLKLHKHFILTHLKEGDVAVAVVEYDKHSHYQAENVDTL